jgi:uncharacterized RDD family membrane protein YckC
VGTADRGASGIGPPPTAIVGWLAPDAASPATPVAGFVTAGIGSRLVAWVLDGIIVTILGIVIAIGLFLVTGLTIEADPVVVSLLIGVVVVTLEFIYLVGFWTGPRRATPAMRLLSLEVVDAASGSALALRAAAIRWLALGYPLGVITAIPGIGELATWLLAGWSLALLMSTAMNARSQGIHDRLAGSVVLRRAGATDGAAAIGCVLAALVIAGLFVVLPILALIAGGAQIEQILSEIGESI